MKPFYGVASMPKSERCSPFVIQQKLSTMQKCLDLAPMISIKKNPTINFLSGGIPTSIQLKKKIVAWQLL
jgi:hypothetical protein